ncbi:MAG: tRNA uridine-5-carboxymethylaminomethyl(34) synthesis GTPase MnmE [Cyclobacteriaceae bacterium]|nr:tRNA uridine-5-carboxymethylaminomethyl(34) synthesis GTPase MnmE [Cyclobacteriaceae bacterium]MDW8332072.1 tRNA uridine-5-carboxymethylaminomethyl(34) synthesis GTPase MnmE [Cyclobacteriaceae bacterium]
MNSFHTHTDTIIAPATPHGISALAIIRLSGNEAISLAAKVFTGKDLTSMPSHRVAVGFIQDEGRILDEVVVTVFRKPRSYTCEDMVEISCHGSPVVVREIINLFTRMGARLAMPGEFTRRAFLNGRLDLAQAEAVADIIHAETENARQAAMNQMRGGFSKEIKQLREQLIDFAALIELELDFGEEDVEFARRDELKALVQRILDFTEKLIASFASGNVIKNGIPTVIAGKPNAGKSTLLNALLNEERAIVSDIPGTTRDTIEDEIILGGLLFRFIDTAGLRHTTDLIEAKGVERTRQYMQRAALILYLIDLTLATEQDVREQEEDLKKLNIPYLLIGNKTDKLTADELEKWKSFPMVFISASAGTNLDELKQRILEKFHFEQVKPGDVLVTNARHYQSLVETRDALKRVLEGLEKQISGELLAFDIRQAQHHLGEITGSITSEDLLDSIFSRFCIGK